MGFALDGAVESAYGTRATTTGTILRVPWATLSQFYKTGALQKTQKASAEPVVPVPVQLVLSFAYLEMNM